MAQSQQVPATTGYAHADAWDSGYIKVDDIHQVYYEQYGLSGGKPVVFLHGGPGGQTSKANTCFFNPEIYHVVLFDQRGAGKSTPLGELRENTSWHLVDDIERIRKHVKVDKWHMVFGGSWGSTLALMYAQTYPQMVGSLVLRGIFGIQKSEMAWSFGNTGLRCLFPDLHEDFMSFLTEDERADPLAAYYKRITSNDTATKFSAARAWNKLELLTSRLTAGEEDLEKLDDENWCLAHALYETHYFINGAWMEDGQLFRKGNLAKIQHIPTSIVHGRYDVCCPPSTAWDLHKGLPASRLFMIADAGHAGTEPGTRKKLIEICNEYSNLSIET